MQIEINKVELRNLQIEDYKQLKISMQHAYNDMEEPYWTEKDIEKLLKIFGAGKKLARLIIATNENYFNDKGEKVTDTQWHTVTAWGKTAEIIEKYVKKGKEIAVEGKLTHRSYDDKNGEKRYITEVLVSDVLLFSK